MANREQRSNREKKKPKKVKPKDNPPTTFAKQLDGLEGRPRVWILYTHLSHSSEELQIGATLRRLNIVGRRLAAFEAVGAHAYLYDLRVRSH